ncbi:MAG: suppressor of fused domain protein [Planctomycetaceae bacterium]|nr:suppressor of fused domain protein [Planctomycetaceae bacterium]
MPILDAVLCESGDARERVQLLEHYGANLHVVYPFGPNSVPMTPLGLATLYGLDDVVSYLRSRGARLPSKYSPQEIATYLGEPEPAGTGEPSQGGSAEQDESPTYADQTLSYFTEHFGPVDPLSLIEIVPTEPQVTVHFIPADASRKCVTLFTTGLAEAEMKAPDEEGAADFRHAELFLQLPADWKYRAYEDPRYAWPIHWLRTIARYPVAADAWLGGPATIFAAGEPLGAGLRFDSWLLMAERKYSAEDGRTVQLYRLTPLYPEERELEEREGIGALLRAFDKHGTPFVIDPNRRNVAT